MQAQQNRKTILITGASGLLGATALSELRRNYNVFGTFRNHPVELENTACFRLDINDSRAVEDVLTRI
jgi:nucleoside-diphosphate-sugar epimerase